MTRLIIPAGGTVRFIAFDLPGDQLEIRNGDSWVRHDGGKPEWRRPCVGLVFEPGLDGLSDPLRTAKDGDWLTTTELVVDEVGSVYRVNEYLHQLLGGDHWDHVAHFFEPHIAGPVTDAPRMRVKALIP